MPQAVEQNAGNGNPAWRTPPELAREIIARYGLDYDAFADVGNAVCRTFSTIEGTYRAPLRRVLAGAELFDPRDGFAFPWAERGVFLNPPYSRGMGPRVATKCVIEASGLQVFENSQPVTAPARIVVALLMCDTSTIYWRKLIAPNAESITYLPRVRYELSPEDLEAWREAGAQRNLSAELGRGRTGVVADLLTEHREKMAKREPDSPNFGSAVIVFKGPQYTVRGVADESDA